METIAAMIFIPLFIGFCYWLWENIEGIVGNLL